MIRYAITAGAAHEPAQSNLPADARRWAEDGIDFVQLREKHLSDAELLAVARKMLQALRSKSASTRLLINGRPDIAAAARADGVHLTSAPGELTPAQVRRIYAAAKLPAAVISASCHSLEQVRAARDGGVDLILFGPVFEKRVGGRLVGTGTGLSLLERACRTAGGIPVLALGGITRENAPDCLSAGAAGIAGIRLFS